MKPFIVLLITMLVTGCVSKYWDEFRTIEVNGTTITIPNIGYAVPKAIRNNLIVSNLTAHEIKTLEPALPVVIQALRFTQSANLYDKLKDQFSDADVTFFYKYILEHAITDRNYGLPAIIDWNVTPTSIAFTYYDSMRNDTDDGYGGDDKYYYIKIRYYFVTNDQGEWAFVKNEFIGFAPDER